MKVPSFLLILVAVVAMSFNQPAAPLTAAERKYATDLMRSTADDLIKKIKDLTPEQLSFKADAGSWSIAECVEHIALSESQLFGWAQSTLQEPADPSKRSEVKTKDEDVVKMVTDRSQKNKADERLTPSGKFSSVDAALEEFKTQREKNITYIRTTSDDLRNHYADLPFGKADTYQIILLMAAHSRRHTLQIDEVMKNAAFPKRK